MFKASASLAVVLAAGSALVAEAAIKTGPEKGATVPSFSLPDQNGKSQTLESVAGPKGTMLVFYRSADW
jgi:hypothetical protein